MERRGDHVLTVTIRPDADPLITDESGADITKYVKEVRIFVLLQPDTPIIMREMVKAEPCSIVFEVPETC